MLSLHITQKKLLLIMITTDSFFHAAHKLGFELVEVPHLIMQSDCAEGEQNKQK